MASDMSPIKSNNQSSSPVPPNESIPIPADNINQKTTLDSNLLAYIDHSLKSLIGTNFSNNNHLSHIIQPTPLFPTVITLPRQFLYF